MSGAGISTASGIQDFRSPGSGMYITASGIQDFRSPGSGMYIV